MKKNLLVLSFTLLCFLSFSTGILAVEKTIIEEKWDNLFDTASLQYQQNHGEFQVYGIMETSEYSSWLYNIIDFQYGIYKNMELGGFIDYGKYEIEGMLEGFLLKSYSGSLKCNFYNKNGLALAAKGYIQYVGDLFESETSPNFGGVIYLDKDIFKNLTVYNSFVLHNTNTHMIKNLNNNFQLIINKNHALKAYLTTSFINLTNPEFTTGAAYKADFERLVYMLDYTKISNVQNHLFIHTVETTITPTTTITGELTLNTNRNINNNWKINYKEKVGSLTLNAAFASDIPGKEEVLSSALSSQIDVNLTQNMSFIVSGMIQTYKKEYYEPFRVYGLLLGLKVEI